jgi:hypothetical protein
MFSLSTSTWANSEVASSANAPAGSDLSWQQSQDVDCRELAVGKSVAVNDDFPKPPRTNERRFQATRTKKDEIKLQVNLLFDPTAEAIGEMYPNQKIDDALKKKASEAMRSKVQGCFNQYARILKDKKGMKLKVEILADPSRQDVPSAKVKIDGKSDTDFPVHNDYKHDEDCSVLIHETLHWTGLVDGYPSKEFCRHVEPRDSIYNSASWALEKRVDLVVCTCNSDACRNEAYSVRPSSSLSCPDGYTSTRKDARAVTIIEGMWDSNKVTYNTQKGVVIKTTPYATQPENALKTLQIKAITNPYCTRDNLYLQCAENAYRKKTDGCAETPAACNQPDYLN